MSVNEEAFLKWRQLEIDRAWADLETMWVNFKRPEQLFLFPIGPEYFDCSWFRRFRCMDDWCSKWNGELARQYPQYFECSGMLTKQLRLRPIGERMVYFVQESGTNAIKIGTTRNVKQRISELMLNVPYLLSVLTVIEGNHEVEHALHARFAKHRIRGEWFRPVPELLTYIEEAKLAQQAADDTAKKHEATRNPQHRILDLIPADTRGLRDRAMLLVGWQGGGRSRSEIAGARVSDFFTTAEGGLRWTVGKNVVTIPPVSDERYCPVRAFKRWLEVSKIKKGYVFRGVASGAIMDAPLAPDGVASRVMFYVAQLGLHLIDFCGDEDGYLEPSITDPEALLAHLPEAEKPKRRYAR